VRRTIVTLVLLALLAALGVSLWLGAAKTRDYAGRLLGAAPPSASPSASASAATSEKPAASGATPAPSGSAAADPKSQAARQLSVVGLGWELLAPGLLAAEGLKSTDSSAVGRAGLKVSFSVAGAMSEVERALASGGAAGGADLALVPLSELVSAYERLRALDPRVLFVAGWSQGKDTLLGTKLSQLPSSGSLGVEYAGGAEPLMLALLTLDSCGVSLERVRLDEHLASAVLRARGGALLEPAATKQEDLVLGTREASRLLPYVLVAPGPQIDQREAVLADFVQAFLAGTAVLLKDRAQAARTLSALDGAPEPLALLHALGDWEPIGLYENTALLGLSGRGALPLEALIDWQFRVRRGAHLGQARAEQSLVDARIVTRLARSQPSLLRPDEPPKRRASGPSEPLLEHVFAKDDEEAITSAIGTLAAVFPRYDLRVTLPTRSPKAQAELLDRASLRYDLDRARLSLARGPLKGGGAALVQVLRAL
jgi:hypothetical protein